MKISEVKKLAETKDGYIKNYSKHKDWVNQLYCDENQKKILGIPNSRDFVEKDFFRHLKTLGINKGLVCEIGGPNNSFLQKPGHGFDAEFISIYPDNTNDYVNVGDITNCKYIDSNKYDAIFSLSVFEHISKPWRAAIEMTRMLKPGGLMYHIVPFRYFYHGAPADYFRYISDAIKILFERLRPIDTSFLSCNLRRDNRGGLTNPIDRDGGKGFSIDSFGGWRENGHKIYAGVKHKEWLEKKINNKKQEVVVNAMKFIMMNSELSDSHSAKVAKICLNNYYLGIDCEIVKNVEGESNLRLIEADILHLWRNRGKGSIPKPDYSYHVQGHQTDLPFFISTLSELINSE